MMDAGQVDEVERLREALAEAGRQAERDHARIEELRRAAEEQRRETQHQVRNILSVVRSIVRRSVAEGASAEDYQMALDGRLASFTRLQAYVLRDPPGGVDLYTLVSGELLAFGVKPGAQAHLDGADLSLQPKAAAVLGLAFHELACIALDRAGPESADDRVEVAWRLLPGGDGPARLRIEWTLATQRPGGPPLKEAAGQDFLEQGVPYALGGDVSLQLADDGLRCVFDLPTGDVLMPSERSLPPN